MTAYTSRLHTAQPIGAPAARLNPGGDGVPPFATVSFGAMVSLGADTYMTIYSWTEAIALRDAFQKAADLLSEVTP